jgi:hypothetical protein
MPKHPDYGIDAPGVLVTLLLLGVLGQFLGLFAPPLAIGPVTIVFGLFLLEAVLMWIYVKWGKLKHRDRMLAQVTWTAMNASRTSVFPMARSTWSSRTCASITSRIKWDATAPAARSRASCGQARWR